MDRARTADVVRNAAAEALESYLKICGLDSPWEVPESFLASESAKALAANGFRVAIEFNLDNAQNCPSRTEIIGAPVRLQKAHSKLDVVILKSATDPWHLEIDGIIEFKKHDSLMKDAEIIEFMMQKHQVTHGILALLLVGSSAANVLKQEARLTETLTSPRIDRPLWQKIPTSPAPTQFQTFPSSNVGHSWWTICCMIPA